MVEIFSAEGLLRWCSIDVAKFSLGCASPWHAGYNMCGSVDSPMTPATGCGEHGQEKGVE